MTAYAALNCVMIGASLYVAVQYICLWRQDWRARTPLLSALVSFSGALVLVCAVGIHASNTVSGAQRFIEWRSLTGLVFSVAQLWLYAEFSANRPRKFLWSLTVFFAVIFLVIVAGFPLHSRVIGVVPRTLPWGDTLWFPIRQTPRWWGGPIYGVTLSIPAFAVVAGSGLRRKDRGGGTLLVVTGITAFIVYLSAAIVDQRRLPLPFPAVFSVWLYMVFAVVLVSREYRQRNARLAASESRQAAVFNASNDAIFVLDSLFRVVTSNPAAVRLAGCGHDQCVPSCAQRLHCQLTQLLERLTREGFDAGSFTKHSDAIVSQNDGTEIPVEAVVQRLTDDPQIAWLVTLRDLRERLRQQQEHRQMERLSSLGLLAGGVAHDFRNVLTGVMGVSALMRANRHKHDLHTYAEMLAQYGSQATELCDDLLRFARRDVGTPEVYDVHEAVRTSAKLFYSSTSGIRVHLDGLVAERSLVLGFQTQLRNALLNLFFNARDAMPRGGTITIRSSVRCLEPGQYSSLSPNRIEPGQHLELAISDTGEGMGPHVLKQCFEPLFTTKASKGTGLGLSSVRSAIIDHRGAVEVTSTLGQGTTFIIFLPLYNEATTEVRPTEATSSALV